VFDRSNSVVDRAPRGGSEGAPAAAAVPSQMEKKKFRMPTAQGERGDPPRRPSLVKMPRKISTSKLTVNANGLDGRRVSAERSPSARAGRAARCVLTAARSDAAPPVRRALVAQEQSKARVPARVARRLTVRACRTKAAAADVDGQPQRSRS
jgi:hypothetical protein